MMLDEEIYDLYLKGNKDSLVVLEDNYRYKLTEYAFCFVNNTDIAKEIVDRAFYRISIFQYDELKKNFCANMYQMTRRIALKVAKENALHKEFTIELTNGDYDDSQSWIENFNKIEGNKMLYQTLNQIDPMAREVIFLAIIQEISEKDIAIILKKRERTASKILKKSKEKLRKLLAGTHFKDKNKKDTI